MSCEVRASLAIRERGIRVTQPRLAVLAALMHAGGHVTAKDVVQQVIGEAPTLPPSSVYRSLSALRDAHLVAETLMANGERIYEAAVEGNHHHIECARCGAVQQIPAEMFDELRLRLRKEFGFEADLQHLALQGRCAQCSQATPPEGVSLN